MRFTCIFCGATRHRSKEDVISKWMQKLLPLASGEIAEHRLQFGDRVQPQRIYQALVYKVPRRVCRKCNNEWMGRIESDVQPFLGPMILGQALTLSQDQQAV